MPVESKVDASVEEDQSNAAQRRKDGEFVRPRSTARNFIGTKEFPAEPGRYHLYVAYNCPWSHRCTLARAVLGLEESITMDVAFPNRTLDDDPEGPNWWQFVPDKVASGTGKPLPECTAETATGQGFRLLRDVYRFAGVTDQKSVPLLYDKKTQRVVSNESAEIVRMLGQHAAALGGSRNLKHPLYPSHLASQIDQLNQFIYTSINNGSYKAGFSSKQSAYDEAFDKYFTALDAMEDRLAKGGPFLLGQHPTEADLRLFPTIYRHDPIYYTRMKLNQKRIRDLPHLWRWTCRMYALPGVAESSQLLHCRQGYFGRSWNNVVPRGPSEYPEIYNHPEAAVENNKNRGGKPLWFMAVAAFAAGATLGWIAHTHKK